MTCTKKEAVRIGFFGFGKAAAIFAEDIKNEDNKNHIVAYDKFQDVKANNNIRRISAKIGIELVDSPSKLAEQADIIFSLVTPSAAEEAANEIAPYLGDGKIYLDMNSTAPMTKYNNYQVICSKNPSVIYIDGCILGAVTESRIRTPILLCGNNAYMVQKILCNLGMNIQIIQGTPGDASAVKMLRSVFMKGIEVLFIETLHAARLYNIEKNVLDTIANTFETLSFNQLVNMLITSHALHAERRQGEMDEVIETLKARNVNAIMTEATRQKLGWSVGLDMRRHFNFEMPADFNLVIDFIAYKAKK